MNDQIPPEEIRLRKGKHELLALGNIITIDERIFDLGSVDRLVYHAATRINHLSIMIGLAQGAEKRKFMFDAYARGTELEDGREAWRGLVALLEGTACPRIARDAARAISSGGTFTFGSPPAARIDADFIGLRHRHPFAKKVPWEEVARADLSEGQVRVWTAAKGGTENQVKMSIDMSGWNAVVLPRVVSLLGSL